MFQVGDLVIYEDVALANDIPGIVVRFDDDRLEVQWFDWEPGCIAGEDPKQLVVVSSVTEDK